MIEANHLSAPDWLSAVEAAARGDMAGDPEATKCLDEMGPAAVILRLVDMVRRLSTEDLEMGKITTIAGTIAARPCGRCDPEETGAPCAEHGESCWNMYLDEAEDVYRQFILPLENELKQARALVRPLHAGQHPGMGQGKQV